MHGRGPPRGGTRHALAARIARRRYPRSPEWPDLAQGRTGIGRLLERGLEACIFAAGQQSRREGALTVRASASSPQAQPGIRRDQAFVHRDIVEITETILQRLEPGQKCLLSLRCLLARKQAGEEFGCVAGLLAPNAQLVPAARVELPQYLAFVAELLPAPPQLRGSECRNRNAAAIPDEIVLRLRPLPGLQPGREIEQ